METTKYAYPAQFINEENGSISVFFPDLHGCFTGGYDTLEESAIMAVEALEGYIEVLLENGEKLPTPSKFATLSIPSEIAGAKVCGGCIMFVVADVATAHNPTESIYRYKKR